MDRRTFIIGTAATAASLLSVRAQAAGTTLKIVFPYTSGSGGDTLARVLADELEKKMGRATIVENKPGADGRIGVREVQHADPDGNTLLFTPFATMTLFPSVFDNLPYDPFNDFAPVTQVVTFDFGLATGPMTGAKSLPEVLEWLKKNPDKANVAVPALGTLPHLLPLKFAETAGIKLKAISYKGTAGSLTAIMGGQVPLACVPLGDLVAQSRAGTIHLLAASGKQRDPQVKEVPTFIELGYKISGSGWYGIFAPAKTPAAEIAKLNKALVDSIHSEAFKSKAASLWLNPTGTTPAELAAIQKADAEFWGPVVKAANLPPR